LHTFLLNRKTFFGLDQNLTDFLPLVGRNGINGHLTLFSMGKGSLSCAVGDDVLITWEVGEGSFGTESHHGQEGLKVCVFEVITELESLA
jgi:hypothetical protein